MRRPRPLLDLALIVLGAAAVTSLAIHAASAGRTRSNPGLHCPQTDVEYDLDLCPIGGTWGMVLPDTSVAQDAVDIPPPVKTRAEVCMELFAACAGL